MILTTKYTKSPINQLSPHRIWKSKVSQRVFLDHVARSVAFVKTQRDWARVTNRMVTNYGGIGFLMKYKKSLLDGLISLYPEFRWENCQLRDKLPKIYWETPISQQRFLEELAHATNVKIKMDWKNVTRKLALHFGGKALLGKYNSRLFNLINVVYPALKWDNLNWNKMPNKFWESPENQRSFLDHLAQMSSLKIQSDWKIVTSETFCHFGGRTLLGSWNIPELLRIIYPELNWENFRPEKNIRYYWDSFEKQRFFFDEMAQKFPVNIQRDWYDLGHEEIQKFGGQTLLLRHRGTLSVLAEIYSEFNWEPFLLKKVPRRFWEIPENQVQFSKLLESYYNIQKKEDWYRLSSEQIKGVAGRYIPKKVIIGALQSAFPTEKWNYGEFSKRNKKSRQKWLLSKIQDIFGTEDILEEFYHSGIKRKSGIPINFDIYVPKLSLAFEFHGEQHYKEIPAAGFPSLEYQHLLDKEKIDLCLENGIRLIIIPHWWDNKVESLVELLENNGLKNNFKKN